MADDHEATALDYQDRIAAMSDAEIWNAYRSSDALAGEDPWTDALAESLEERGVDI